MNSQSKLTLKGSGERARMTIMIGTVSKKLQVERFNSSNILFFETQKDLSAKQLRFMTKKVLAGTHAAYC